MDRSRTRGRLTYKIILLGELGVGKTSLFRRLRDNIFDEARQTSSINTDHCNKEYHVDGENIMLNIWDTAGVERYRTLTKNYYRGAHAVALIYSMDDPSSLHYLSQWVRDAEEYADGAVHFLFGNKSDEASLINEETVKDFAATHNIEHIFTLSAKSGENVDETMTAVARTLRAPSKNVSRLVQYHGSVDFSAQNSRICLEDENDNINAKKSKGDCC